MKLKKIKQNFRKKKFKKILNFEWESLGIDYSIHILNVWGNAKIIPTNNKKEQKKFVKNFKEEKINKLNKYMVCYAKNIGDGYKSDIHNQLVKYDIETYDNYELLNEFNLICIHVNELNKFYFSLQNIHNVHIYDNKKFKKILPKFLKGSFIKDNHIFFNFAELKKQNKIFKDDWEENISFSNEMWEINRPYEDKMRDYEYEISRYNYKAIHR